MFISSNLSKNGRGEKRTSFVKINSAFAYQAKAVIRASQFHPPAGQTGRHYEICTTTFTNRYVSTWRTPAAS
jgi:hypothetical protein